MTTSNGVKWLLVGTGDIVRKRVASALGSNLVGVCGGRQRAQAIADEHGADSVYDVRRLRLACPSPACRGAS